MDLYIVVEESARLGPARLCKVILVGREGVRELGRDRLGLGCASRDVPARYMRLETISFGDSRGILHEGLVGVGARDIAPLTIKSVPQPRSYLNNACRVYEFFPSPGLYLGMTFILVDRGLTIPRPLMVSVSFAELGYGLAWFRDLRVSSLHPTLPYSTRRAYARAVVEKRPRCDHDPDITFRSEDEKYPDHDDALVISS
ncbi:hypothetical protein BHE74_00001903 [Ensete ventricosum]|nr:hypothetical protein BHE74_00001903 [Ensete ventricosum]